MTQAANTTRTNAGGRAVSLAALAALLVVLASADAAMRVTSPGGREAMECRPATRTSVAGLGRIVEGLLACAALPDVGWREAPVEPTGFVCRPGQVRWALAPAFGLSAMLDLPPPAVA